MGAGAGAGASDAGGGVAGMAAGAGASAAFFSQAANAKTQSSMTSSFLDIRVISSSFKVNKFGQGWRDYICCFSVALYEDMGFKEKLVCGPKFFTFITKFNPQNDKILHGIVNMPPCVPSSLAIVTKKCEASQRKNSRQASMAAAKYTTSTVTLDAYSAGS